jgi:D-alanyl-D-alanine carboxypeptidase
MLQAYFRTFRKAGIVLLCALFCGLTIPAAQTSADPAPIRTNAEAAALIDVKSGRIIYEKNGDKPMKIASLTKIMTAIVAIENGDLSDMVEVSANAAGKEGSSIYLKPGDTMSLHNLLYGLMLRSGNDAATAIAEHVGGSVEGFVYLMNEKAQMIGLTGTQFKNPHGLDEEGHYSTAKDLAKLTAYALRNPVFQEIVKTKTKTTPSPDGKGNYYWYNKNKMLSIFDGADGVKTGYTKLAKRCLVSSATRNGQQLAAVTLNDPDDWADHAKLLNYGFEHYPLSEIVRKGDRIEGTTFVVGKTFVYPLSEEERGTLRKEATLLSARSIGYAFGDRGTLTIFMGDRPIGTVPLYAENSPKLNMPERTAFVYKESASSETAEWFAFLRRLGATFARLLTLSSDK